MGLDGLKILRPLLFVACALALVAGAALLALMAPPFQTWLVRMELADVAGVRASLSSFSAGFGRMDVEGLKAERAGAVLTLPSLEARLPLVGALWSRDVRVASLVAKGWTLDLSGLPAEAEDNPEAKAAEAAPVLVEKALGSLLGGSRLPFDLSVGSVDLEGEVILPASAGRPPVKAHVTLDGGGFRAGRSGELTLEAVAASGTDTATVQAAVSADMDTARTINGLSVRATVGSFVSGRQADIRASASVRRRAGSMSYSVEVGPPGRAALAVSAAASGPSAPLRGSWKADLRSGDLAAVLIGWALPQFSAAGSGVLETDPGLQRIRISGAAQGSYGQLGRAVPWLSSATAGGWDGAFEVELRPGALTVSRLSAHLLSPGPVVSLQTLQRASLDLTSGEVAAADPASDLASVRVGSLPLSSLPRLPGGFGVSGSASADFTVAARGGSLLLRIKGPVRAAGVSVFRGGEALARGLVLEAAASGSIGAGAGGLSLSPLTLDGASGRIAEATVEISPPTAKQPGLPWSGSLTVHPGRIGALAGNGWTAPTATFEGKGRLGADLEVDGALRILGPDGQLVSGTVNADTDAGSGEFLAPLSVAMNGATSAITAEGSWSGSGADARLEVKLSSDDAWLSHALLLLSPFWERGASGDRRSAPFWGDWRGRLSFAFGKVRTTGGEYADAGGTLDFGDDSIDFMGGHAEVGPRTMATADARLGFEPAGTPGRYRLSGKIALLGPLDASLVIPKPVGEDPVLEGKFVFSGTVEGRADTLGELASSATASLHFSSQSGIVRLLKTDVADAVPEESERVSDSAEAVGNFIGSTLLGIKGHSLDPARNKVGKVGQAVIDFTNLTGEVGYDKAEAFVVIHADGTVDLRQLELVAPDLHLFGTGWILREPGKPLSAEPLSLELKVGVKDAAAARLAAAGLLSKSKDSEGYSLLDGTARFAGTMASVDSSAWHDLLAAPIKASQKR